MKVYNILTNRFCAEKFVFFGSCCVCPLGRMLYVEIRFEINEKKYQVLYKDYNTEFFYALNIKL